MNDKIIILVTPSPISHRTAEENLGIAYLASILRENHYNVIIIDAWLEGLNTYQVVSKILEIPNILYIGFSCYRSNMNQAVEISQVIKANRGEIPMIAGGFGPSFYAKDFLDAGFDFVVKGEAENTIIELTNFFIGKGNDLTAIKGIIYKDGDNIIYNKTNDLILNIDNIPFPARDTLLHTIKRKSMVSVLSSRGCQANCIFCSVVAFQKLSNGTQWRQRSMNNFIDELERLYDKECRFFKIVDDSFIEFPRNEKWCEAFANEIEKRNMKELHIRASIRADRVNREIIYHLKRAGFFSFSCGIENGSTKALKRMGKPSKIEDNINALRIFNEFDIFVQAGYILFDPYTTIEELNENCFFLKEHKYMISKGIFTEMYAAEGTPFNTLLDKKNMVKHDFSNNGNSKYSLINTDVMPIYESLKIWHKANSLVYDKVIDPISAPKSLEIKELKLFYDLFFQLREYDLFVFEKLLSIANERNKIFENEAFTFVKEEIQKSRKFYDDILLKANKLYIMLGLEYNASINPFIT